MKKMDIDYHTSSKEERSFDTALMFLVLGEATQGKIDL